MFDLDNLKAVNDTLGHRTGDTVLVEMARLTRSTVRSTNIMSRLGGGEFLIVCPETELAKALKLAERLPFALPHGKLKKKHKGRKLWNTSWGLTWEPRA